MKKYYDKYDEIVKEAQTQNPSPEKVQNQRGRPKKGKIRALIDRLEKYKTNWTLFFTNFNVPFTNNQAERDFRTVKVKMNTAKFFQTKEGANEYAKITSYTSTAQKRGMSPHAALVDALSNNTFTV